MATASYNVDTVTVFANRGDGSFQAGRDYTTGLGPFAVAIGDLNGDRKPELVTANTDANSVSVLANTGHGSFQAKRDYATGESPSSVAIGDLNGDRKPEFAAANTDANSVSVLTNTTGRCSVPDVRGKTLLAAKRMVALANCRIGRVRHAYSIVKKGRVITQMPKSGTVLSKRASVNLVVSRGRMR